MVVLWWSDCECRDVCNTIGIDCYGLIALGKSICDLTNNLVVKINKKKNNKKLNSIYLLDCYVNFTLVYE
ncbi:hypothetical protein EGC77_18420 [Shewanella psychromarinicola]|uniref:Uncharacterized protein n=1 Tax=Shewanella psychromarinicola TaxID=2487742 RepID=A0A3N4DI18_9GAMM|nr:hypothetical protein EGC77_18420 [Shewanella psychromarinicola]